MEEKVVQKEGSGSDTDSELDEEQVPVEAPEPKEYVPKKKVLSCVRFAIGTQVLVTGDSNGSVDVYKIFGMLDMDRPRVLGLELERLSQAMQPDPMNKH